MYIIDFYWFTKITQKPDLGYFYNQCLASQSLASLFLVQQYQSIMPLSAAPSDHDDPVNTP